jgi:hypothetical protein
VGKKYDIIFFFFPSISLAHVGINHLLSVVLVFSSGIKLGLSSSINGHTTPLKTLLSLDLG